MQDPDLIADDVGDRVEVVKRDGVDEVDAFFGGDAEAAGGRTALAPYLRASGTERPAQR